MKNKLVLLGCSYGLQPIFFNKTFPDVSVTDLSRASSPMEVISDIGIECISKLLETHSPSELFVVYNITQIGRPYCRIPKEYTEFLSGDFLTANHWGFDFSEKSGLSDVFKYSDKCIKLLGLQPYDDEAVMIREHITREMRYQITNKSFEEKVESYLESIYLLQSFLKEKNIKNLGYMMNNTFQGWFDSKNVIKHIYTETKGNELPNLKDSMNIWEISNKSNIYFDLINLSDIVFFESDYNKFGGLDEYTFSKFGIDYFGDVRYDKNLPIGHHPITEVEKSFFLNIILDRITPWFRKTTI